MRKQNNQRCANGANQCHLHVHFHGCGVEKSLVGDGYIQRLGLLPLAEDNDIILMFPQIKHSLLQGNPLGCWDWWGYEESMWQLSPLHDSRDGEQLGALVEMTRQLARLSDDASLTGDASATTNAPDAETLAQ